MGLRYGRGLLYMKNNRASRTRSTGRVPAIGWDVGGNAGAHLHPLLQPANAGREIYQRFPGIEGSAYFIGGLGVNYQRADDVTLAPIRAGVGLRLGANVGYLATPQAEHPPVLDSPLPAKWGEGRVRGGS